MAQASTLLYSLPKGVCEVFIGTLRSKQSCTGLMHILLNSKLSTTVVFSLFVSLSLMVRNWN